MQLERLPLLTNTNSKCDPTEYRYIILGAGCAGLSLAWYLLEAGIKEPILLLDQRREYKNDRTWCYWSVEPTPFDDLTNFSWKSWEVFSDQSQSAVSDSTSYPYLYLSSERFYHRVLNRLKESPQVTLRLGQQLQGYEEVRGKVVVHTTDGSYTGRQLFTSVAQPAPLPKSGETQQWLQHFRGQRIQTNRPVFNSNRLTLMDHRVSQKDGPHFVYLLPFSPTQALVENTYFFSAEVSQARHRTEIADYLSRIYQLKLWDYEVVDEEAGAVPMGKYEISRPRNGLVRSIGVASGAARPATGYAFLRIQRQCRQIAECAASGKPLPVTEQVFGSRKYDLFDEIMLRVLRKSPQLAPAFFTALFRGASPDSVVRFLSEQSSLTDDLRIIRALLQPDFVRLLLSLTRDQLATLSAAIRTPPLPNAFPK